MPLKPLVASFLLLVLPLVVFSQWQPQASPTTFGINDILFLTDNVGFIGTHNSIYKTSDGGLTWATPQYPGGVTDLELLSSSYIYDIHFFDQSHGLMVGSGFYNGYNIIARTTDGGATWRLVYSQPVAGGVLRVPLTNIAFLDANVGYAVGGNGVILKTLNSGDSWTPVASPTTNNVKKVLFVDSQRGFIAGDKVLLRTTDAGATWQTTSTAFDINDLYFTTANSGIATTAEGIILNTVDGGISWTEHAINFEARLGKIVFQGETGYVIGYEGLFNRFILKTTDGGKVWEHQFPAAVNNLSGITVAPGGKVWTGGLYGKLFATTNGGGNSYPIASFSASGTAFCENQGYTFSNNGPENKYAYEWRVDGVLKGTGYNFSTTFTGGNHTIELKAINGQLSGKKERQFYVESTVNFTKPLELVVANGLCEGSGTVITVKEPEYGSYKLFNGAALGAEDNDYSNGILLTTPALQSTTTFRVTATRANSCETVEIHRDTTVNVYTDLRLGSTLHLVQDYFCNSGVPAVEITSSRAYVRYELFSDDKLISSSVGNGQTITLQAPAIQDTSQYKVKASVVNGACERWFDDILEIKVEKVNAAFHLSVMNAGVGESVTVYNKSHGATDFEWTFPNASPATSGAASPGAVTFSQPGTWQAELRASSTSGCTDVETGSIHVYDDSFLNLSCWATGTGYNVEGSSAYQEMTNLALAPNGDILTTGYYLGQAEFDSKAGPDFKTNDEVFITNFLSRYSAKGVLKWVLNTSRYEVENSTNPMIGSKAVIGSDGSIYLLTSYGSFEPVFYSTDGDSIQPYKGVFIYPASQQYLIKYSEDGILQWVRSKAEITGDMLSSQFIDLEIDGSDNLYVVTDNLYKLSGATGDVISNVTVFDSPPNLQIADFALSGDGSWYCISNSSSFVIVKKYSSGGLVEWENTITSSHVGYGGSSVGPDNNLILFGRSLTTTKFESEGESDRLLDPKSFFILKYDLSGKIVWLNTALTGDIRGESIAINEQGEMALAIQGYSPSSCTLQSQDGFNFVFNSPASPYLMKYDGNGNIISNNKIFGEDLTMNAGIQLVSRQDQTYVFGIVVHNFTNGVNHGAPTTINGDVIYSQHQGSLFVAKFQSDCDLLSAPALTGSVLDLATGSPVCPGTMFNVVYEVTPGTQLEADNVFSVFLVPENGSGIITAGSLSSTNTQGTIQAIVPANIPEGNTYKIRLWASNPKLYSDVVDSQFSIRATALPDFTYSSSQDLVFRFTPSVGQDVTCKWTVEGNTIEERSPLYKFSTTGLFEVCLIAKDECNVERTMCKNVYVTCSPVPTNYTYTINEKTVTFKGTTNASNTLQWDFGDGSTATTLNTEHTFATYGTKVVCFRSSTECSQGTACKSINLACSQGDLSFSFTSTEKTVQFTNSSAVDYTQFEWNFGDGITSTDKNPSHTYTASGTYLVTLSSSGKCSMVKTLSQSVTVQCTSPTVDFQTEVNDLDVTFTNSSINAVEQTWNLGDGTTSNAVSPQYHYQAAGSYQVCLTSKNNCTQETICKTITVTYPVPAPPTDLVATAVDRSTITLQWNDNSTTEQSFKVTFKETGANSFFQEMAVVAANVTQYTGANFLCDKSYTFKVIAVGQGTNNEAASNEANALTAGLDKPVIISSAAQACEGQLIELGAPAGFNKYLWSTGATAQKISVAATGEYAVSVADGNDCRSVFSDKTIITFDPLPDASVEVVANALRAKATAEHYQWYLDNTPLDGSTSQQITPEVNGNYKVELTNKGCSSMSASIVFVITGLEEQVDNQFTIYPLPADERLFIRFDDGFYEGSSGYISLTSVTGGNALRIKKSTSEKEVEINVSQLPPGLYVCVMEFGEQVIYKKVIIY